MEKEQNDGELETEDIWSWSLPTKLRLFEASVNSKSSQSGREALEVYISERTT